MFFKDILQHFKFVNWIIRFLMSRTGYLCLDFDEVKVHVGHLSNSGYSTGSSL